MPRGSCGPWRSPPAMPEKMSLATSNFSRNRVVVRALFTILSLRTEGGGGGGKASLVRACPRAWPLSAALALPPRSPTPHQSLAPASGHGQGLALHLADEEDAADVRLLAEDGAAAVQHWQMVMRGRGTLRQQQPAGHATQQAGFPREREPCRALHDSGWAAGLTGLHLGAEGTDDPDVDLVTGS